jgi:hypothetical protein
MGSVEVTERVGWEEEAGMVMVLKEKRMEEGKD